MNSIDCLIFDLDGTLIDSKLDIANSVNFARGDLGLPSLPLETIANAVGDGVQSLIERILEPENRNLKQKILSRFKAHYGKHLLDNTVVSPGAREILVHFQNKKKGVLTNKPSQFTLEILEGLGLKSSFGIVQCGDQPEGRKPETAGINRILDFFQVKPDKAVIVGDSPIDIQTGRAASVLTCGVLDGFASKEVLDQSNPDVLIGKLSELKEYFC